MELELQPLSLPSDNKRPFVIAGPCSAETEEQVMTTARQLADKGCHNFRAGVWKPRTKPGGTLDRSTNKRQSFRHAGHCRCTERS